VQSFHEQMPARPIIHTSAQGSPNLENGKSAEVLCLLASTARIATRPAIYSKYVSNNAAALQQVYAHIQVGTKEPGGLSLQQARSIRNILSAVSQITQTQALSLMKTSSDLA